MISIEKRLKFNQHVDGSLLERAAIMTLQTVSAADVDLTLLLTDDKEVQDLNRKFRQVDTPTDVLSFNIDAVNPESGRTHLGDVVLSFRTALKQAKAAGHSVEEELQLLTVHGVLHLLGYDHARGEEKKRMWTLQQKILKLLGLQHIRMD